MFVLLKWKTLSLVVLKNEVYIQLNWKYMNEAETTLYFLLIPERFCVLTFSLKSCNSVKLLFSDCQMSSLSPPTGPTSRPPRRISSPWPRLLPPHRVTLRNKAPPLWTLTRSHTISSAIWASLTLTSDLGHQMLHLLHHPSHLCNNMHSTHLSAHTVWVQRTAHRFTTRSHLLLHLYLLQIATLYPALLQV